MSKPRTILKTETSNSMSKVKRTETRVLVVHGSGSGFQRDHVPEPAVRLFLRILGGADMEIVFFAFYKSCTYTFSSFVHIEF